MNQLPVILIFDIGKTHKKLLLFNEDYQIVHQESCQFQQIVDEEGFPCEDLMSLSNWIQTSAARIISDNQYLLKAINFSAYGASLVYLSDDNKILLPLYNYLKPYLESTKRLFLKNHGPLGLLSQQTASPWLGNLNSGLQFFRLKIEKPGDYAKIKFALHLPQYLSFVLTGKCFSDITSIGCHTMLWDFQNKHYHDWTSKEGLTPKLAPIMNGDATAGFFDNSIPVGPGLHDSSSALVPYLNSPSEPFVLISTGTWCITLNPFNDSPLSEEELNNDVLFYLSYKGKPVKASRIFAGNEHEEQVKRMEAFFNKPAAYYQSVKFNTQIVVEKKLWGANDSDEFEKNSIPQSTFEKRDLNAFPDFETAYHQLIADIVQQQIHSTGLILRSVQIKKLFVEGGFSQNEIYMNLLAEEFPTLKVYSAIVPQASALGAALAIHLSWNKKQIPANLISLKYYAPQSYS